MKGTKEQKAITLIALIITIVVLLILAGVAISSIQENGILGYAQNAADSWNEAQTNEQDTLNGYVDWLKYVTCSHTYVNGICSNCGYSCSVSGGHTFGAGVKIQDADCSVPQDEKHAFTCSVCGLTEERTTKQYSHNWNDHYCDDCGVMHNCDENYEWYEWVYAEPGKHGLTYDCDVCGHSDNIQESCTYENGVCTVCGYEEPEEPECEHPYFEGDKEEHSCPFCGYVCQGEMEVQYQGYWDVCYEYYKCKLCEFESFYEEIGHWFVDGVCKQCGYVEGSEE